MICRSFRFGTALGLSHQTLLSIKNFHGLGRIHRDIKPANFVLGRLPFDSLVFLIDFGMAVRYVTDPKKMPATSAYEFIGTRAYAARTCHAGKPQSRKDDLESWLFVVRSLFLPSLLALLQACEFFKRDILPWSKTGIKDKEVLSMKQTFFHKLRKGMPVFSCSLLFPCSGADLLPTARPLQERGPHAGRDGRFRSAQLRVHLRVARGNGHGPRLLGPRQVRVRGQGEAILFTALLTARSGRSGRDAAGLEGGHLVRNQGQEPRRSCHGAHRGVESLGAHSRADRGGALAQDCGAQDCPAEGSSSSTQTSGLLSAFYPFPILCSPKRTFSSRPSRRRPTLPRRSPRRSPLAPSRRPLRRRPPPRTRRRPKRKERRRRRRRRVRSTRSFLDSSFLCSCPQMNLSPPGFGSSDRSFARN